MSTKKSQPTKANKKSVASFQVNTADDEYGTIKTAKFSFAGIEAPAKCVKITDGDTIHYNMMYNGKLFRFTGRLSHINTAEKDGSTAREKMRGKTQEEIEIAVEEEKKKAAEAKAYLAEHILGKMIYIKCDEFDKYGRVLIDVFLDEHYKQYMNAKMIEGGYAYPYEGEGEKKY